VLSKQDTHHFINTLENLKHKAIISLMYSAGLRVSEACNLKYNDINRKNMTIYIRRSKNRQDRYAILSKNTLDILTQYWLSFSKPMDWLFPSTFNNGEKPIAPFTVHRFIKDHEMRLGWESRISCHTFRHGFGTHLYENGVDIIAIKNAMGHKSLNSTAIYINLAGYKHQTITSPFDTCANNG
jgi:site-specific recombinase XerD